MTLNDFERRNGCYFALILANSVDFGAHCVEVVEDVPKLSATKM